MATSIDSIKRRMLIKYPAFGSVVANLKYVENKNLPTVATDGENIYYNPDFLDRLSEDEQTFLFAHEVCHVAFNHIFRSEGRDKRLWNMATDAVINALLEQDGLKMVEGGVDIPEAVEYDAEAMYEKLLKEKENQQQGDKGESSQNDEVGDKSQSGEKEEGSQNSGEGNNPQGAEKGEDSQNRDNSSENSKSEDNQQQNNGGSSTNDEKTQDVGHDTHDLWEEAIKKAKNKENEASNKEDKADSKEKESIWNKLFNRGEDKQESKAEDELEEKSEADKKMEEQIEKLSNQGEKKAFNQNKIDRKKQLEELREALAKESIGAGNNTNSIGRNIGEIGVSIPLVDWRKMLKEAVNARVDWTYKNASIEDGIITPHIEEIPIPLTEIVLDTSGSINEALLRNFLRECKNILQHSKLKVGCFDTRFYGFNEIRNEKDIENMRFLGGGGTDFNVAVEAFSPRVENKIIFTDGEAPMPQKATDAIWIVFGEEKIKPKGGRVISITSKQLERLLKYDRDMDR